MLNRRELLKLFGVAAAVPAVLSQAISAEPAKSPAVIPEATPDADTDCMVTPSESIVVPSGIEEPAMMTVQPFHSTGVPSGGRIELKCSTITFKDSGSEKEVILHVGEGNITWSQPRDFEYQIDRGRLDTVRVIDEQPLEVSLDMTYDFIKCDDKDWMSIIKARQTNISLQCEDGSEIYNYQFDGFMWSCMEWDLDCATFSISGQCVPEL